MRLLRYFSFFGVILVLASCGEQQQGFKTDKNMTVETENTIIIPAFNSDSAYKYIAAQTAFGPRVPGSEAHTACAQYLEETLLDYTPHVVVQGFKTRVYDKTVLNGKNIIASFQPEKKARILLGAHWDSRPYADHDSDASKHSTPIDGANDGASGVGVLIEIARILQEHTPNVGVDIIFFDIEDYGPPQDSQNEGNNDAWGLGSQYWSSNPHTLNYRARFMILLDMVGASGAKFRKEGFSMYFAADKVDKVWSIAREVGYGDYFLNEEGGYINDDHYYVNEIAGIPAIDIIHLDKNSTNGSFFDHWHTTNDNLDKIDKKTLQAVGDVVTAVVFKEK